MTNDKATVLMHLERLKRHFESALTHYDKVSFLDLSHSLRIWEELAVPLVKTFPEFSSAAVFKSSKPTKKLLALVRGYRHLFALTPQALPLSADVRTTASLEIASPSKPMLLGGLISHDENGQMRMQDPFYVARQLDAAEHKTLYDETKKISAERMNFRQWLEADAARVGYIDAAGQLQQVSLSRKMLIKRTANILDGSHPSIDIEMKNVNDPALLATLQMGVQGIPLPYFILLRMAEDIVHFASKYMKGNGEAEAKGP